MPRNRKTKRQEVREALEASLEARMRSRQQREEEHRAAERHGLKHVVPRFAKGVTISASVNDSIGVSGTMHVDANVRPIEESNIGEGRDPYELDVAVYVPEEPEARPGEWLMTVASRLPTSFGDLRAVIESTMADMRGEHHDAMEIGRTIRAKRILVFGYARVTIAVLKSIGLGVLIAKVVEAVFSKWLERFM